MRLYAFGLKHDNDSSNSNNNYNYNDNARPSLGALAPVLQARSIRVLWAAWCDAVIAYQDGGPWVLRYMGTGLTTAQKECLAGDGDVKRRGGVGEAVFFGTVMHDGLRGYVVKKSGRVGAEDADQKVVLFGTEWEMEGGVPEVQSFSRSGTASVITDVKIDGGGCVVLNFRDGCTEEQSVVRFGDFTLFRRYLSSGEMDAMSDVTILPYESHCPPQCVMNATTITAIDGDMHVWTSTRDPRYPRCLGRSYDGSSDIASLPYLSESYVTTIASGGYMSAAMSSDGELFLWGQACPGSEGELDVLKGGVEANTSAMAISVGGEQDEFVKCLDVRIHGQEATVYDVAVGHGHVLVAVEVSGTVGETKRALFAAGDNCRDQLGLRTVVNFKEAFEEMTLLRGKRIVQLAAAGWSTYVVSLEE